MCTNVTVGMLPSDRDSYAQQFKNRRGCYVKRTGSEHKSHLLSDGNDGHSGGVGKSSKSADNESDAESSRKYVQEYTPADKACESKVRACMYGT